MRLLLVQGAAHRGGAERILLTLARHLPTQGVEPIVGFLADGPFVDEVRAEGIETASLGVLPRARELWRSRRLVEDIAAGVRRVSADSVLANGEKLAPFVGWAGRRTGCPSIAWLHDSPVRSPSSAMLQLALRLSPRDLVIAPSAWMTEQFRRTWRMPVQHIPHGIDIDALPQSPADLRSMAGWPAGVETVVLVGRLQRWKGPDVFLRAAARVARSRPEARFAIIGGALYGWEEDYARSLHALARELGIADRTWFAGHRDDALELVAGADVVAHCSRRPEPFGLVIPEAMGLGRPVVASRTLGPEEIIEDGITGVLTSPEDDAALAAAIIELLNDPQRAAQIGGAAAVTIREHWTADLMAARFAQAIRGLLPI